MTTQDEIYMNRCLELAKMGQGNVAPNPMVGAVVVHDNKIIGEGYHRAYGEPHAEVNAIAAVKDERLLPLSTIYVSLEPCAHYGKTPPCAGLIIEKGIKRVVIGSNDPFAQVNGKGIEMLKAAGISISTGVLKAACDELNKEFFCYHTQKRPYIYLKWAQSLDGYIDIDRTSTQLGQPTWISNELARRLVHKQRAHVDAILVGTNTAFKDNPSLTLRDWHGKQPLRVVIDKTNKLGKELNLFDGAQPSLVFSYQPQASQHNISYAPLKEGEDVPQQILKYLYQQNIQSLVVEGGRQLLQSFIDDACWDEAMVYIGDVWFGGGIKAPFMGQQAQQTELLHNSKLKVFKNNN